MQSNSHITPVIKDPLLHIHAVSQNVSEMVNEGVFSYEELFKGEACNHLSTVDILDCIKLSMGPLGFGGTYSNMRHFYSESRDEETIVELLETHTDPQIMEHIVSGRETLANNLNTQSPYNWESELNWEDIKLKMQVCLNKADEFNYVLSFKEGFTYERGSYAINVARPLTEQYSFKAMMKVNGGMVLKGLLAVYNPSYFSTHTNL